MNLEPVQDGVENTEPPVQNHEWVWEQFMDQMATDWRQMAPKTEPHMTVH